MKEIFFYFLFPNINDLASFFTSDNEQSGIKLIN